jgi:hypothetical protein
VQDHSGKSISDPAKSASHPSQRMCPINLVTLEQTHLLRRQDHENTNMGRCEVHLDFPNRLRVQCWLMLDYGFAAWRILHDADLLSCKHGIRCCIRHDRFHHRRLFLNENRMNTRPFALHCIYVCLFANKIIYVCLFTIKSFFTQLSPFEPLKKEFRKVVPHIYNEVESNFIEKQAQVCI